ncbi:hypothetical protein ACWT_5217 [Actinoplanes sp. SE50]|uniref:hypothetical protein n=1 Tax=unclassified Actinoplanes TaxID=2626549 RepID=UPI00023EBBF3|nr:MULTISPECIES: hypothetical protein [unclassified Actinoplanes]AEV86234.1 hypothetical protein ACPL_5347 [Actinoplanes sp. SE50/110]ATO84632.1 hypothetical protein ACWT_5217 [Actinoplanes sp. SE50]SLM02042.1 hypothetical protein ACSP50_5280 [Actinoplanes sp. SE50/110]
MTTDLDLPAERDLPPAHAARIRATLLHTPEKRDRRALRLAIAASLTIAVASAIAFVRPQPLPTTIALGPGELSSTLEAVVDHCVAQRAEIVERLPEPADLPAVSSADVAVAAETHGQATVLFVNERGFAACSAAQIARPVFGVRIEADGGFTGGPWDGRRDWLPGPVEVLMSGSSDRGGPAQLDVVGRVSSRVARLVAVDGPHQVPASLANGAFGLLGTGDVLGPGTRLIAYDAAGEPIHEEPLFPATADRVTRCWADPTGRVLYQPSDQPPGKPGNCLPAEPWGF